MTFTTAAVVDHPSSPVTLSDCPVAEPFVAGHSCLCNGCGFLADAGSPCEVCMVNAFEMMQANAESSFGYDPHARY